MQCIAQIGNEETRLVAKTEISEICAELMPSGVPQFLKVRNYPSIVQLIDQNGRKVIHGVLLMLVSDFCRSVNVVRNMNEDQMIEAAAMLIDECDTFRLEDYVMMFTMSKRGNLVDIRDRIDIQMISKMMDEYWRQRNKAGDLEQQREHIVYEQKLKQKGNDVWFSDIKLTKLAGWAVLKNAYRYHFSLLVALKPIKEEIRKDEEKRKHERQKEIEAYAAKMDIDIDQIAQAFKQHEDDKTT